MKRAVLVTGGAGFIGSHLVDMLLDAGHNVVVIDKLTYAGNKDNLSVALSSEQFEFIQGDIADRDAVTSLFERHDIAGIYHLAAETHVDNSIADPSPFVQSNVVGTAHLLTAALEYYERSGKPDDFRFVHISTDEVFGDLEVGDDPFTESSAYAPNSPYSASKAASDHFVRAWFQTYGLPVVTTYCTNNFGPRQHAEKLIPTVIRHALSGSEIPIYGTGKNIRDWLYVRDHCAGLIKAAQNGAIGETYCFSGSHEMENIVLAEKICAILDALKPRINGVSYQEQITFVTDRKGHDRRYALSSDKAKAQFGWAPEHDFDSVLRQSCAFFLKKAEE